MNSMNPTLVGDFKIPVENHGWVTPDWMKDVDVRNTAGSTAGAGSGEFHQYRYQRRKEIWRLASMDNEAKLENEIKDYQEMRRRKQENAEVKTSKKAAKRKKRKEKSKEKKKPKSTTNDDATPTTPNESDGESDSKEQGSECKTERDETEAVAVQTDTTKQ